MLMCVKSFKGTFIYMAHLKTAGVEPKRVSVEVNKSSIEIHYD